MGGRGSDVVRVPAADPHHITGDHILEREPRLAAVTAGGGELAGR
jgi:hypothetical protein